MEDGGPAFACVGGAQSVAQQGMSLRDYFAGQALAGGVYDAGNAQKFADNCYLIADAMLIARARALKAKEGT